MVIDFLDTPDIADFAIERLRRWKRWEHTERVLGLTAKKDFDTRIIQRSVLRFALQAPGPAAAKFVAGMRNRDPDFVEDTKDLLDLETPSLK
jgi:hypothetical protein